MRVKRLKAAGFNQNVSGEDEETGKKEVIKKEREKSQ